MFPRAEFILFPHWLRCFQEPIPFTLHIGCDVYKSRFLSLSTHWLRCFQEPIPFTLHTGCHVSKSRFLSLSTHWLLVEVSRRCFFAPNPVPSPFGCKFKPWIPFTLSFGSSAHFHTWVAVSRRRSFAYNPFGCPFKPLIPFTLSFGSSSHFHTLIAVSRRWFFASNCFGRTFKPLIPFTLSFGSSSHFYKLVAVSKRWFFAPKPIRSPIQAIVFFHFVIWGTFAFPHIGCGLQAMVLRPYLRGRPFKTLIPFTLSFGFPLHFHTLVALFRRWFFVFNPFGCKFRPLIPFTLSFGSFSHFHTLVAVSKRRLFAPNPFSRPFKPLIPFTLSLGSASHLHIAHNDVCWWHLQW